MRLKQKGWRKGIIPTVWGSLAVYRFDMLSCTVGLDKAKDNAVVGLVCGSCHRTDAEVCTIQREYRAVTIHAGLMLLQHNVSNQITIFPAICLSTLASLLSIGKSVRAGKELKFYPNVYVYVSLNIYMYTKSASEYFSDSTAVSLWPSLATVHVAVQLCLQWFYGG